MTKEPDLLSYIQEIFSSSEDVTKCYNSLSKLTKHLKEPVTVTGSLATGWHLLKNGKQVEKRCLNDIDIVVENLSGIHTSLSQDFLIVHFHPYREKGKMRWSRIVRHESVLDNESYERAKGVEGSQEIRRRI